MPAVSSSRRATVALRYSVVEFEAGVVRKEGGIVRDPIEDDPRSDQRMHWFGHPAQ